MILHRFPVVLGALLSLTSVPAGAGGYLSGDELTLLRDPDGWEYVKIITDDGFPTEHVCFDGAPHPDQCRGTLKLGTDEKFVKQIFIRGRPDTRTGRYKVDGSQITFFDEFDVQDGPYGITLDRSAKTLVLELAGQRINLMLEKEYRSKNKQAPKGSQPK